MIRGAIPYFLSSGSLEHSFAANGFGFYSATALYRFLAASSLETL
jgi:hypothetical protein